MKIKYQIFCINDLRTPHGRLILERSLFPMCDTEQEAEQLMTAYLLENKVDKPYEWVVIKTYTNI